MQGGGDKERGWEVERSKGEAREVEKNKDRKERDAVRRRFANWGHRATYKENITHRHYRMLC